jgi:arsenite methyltransferase
MKSTTSTLVEIDVELAVSDRYTAASKAAEPALCCAVQYDQKYLAVLPPELIERDYGCGDPSRYVREGESVLDLGSGGGKVCYIASQIVGPRGRVIGVDMNEEMLALARRYREEIGNRLGWHNVEFRRGRIQDLALDLDQFDRSLREQPVATADEWLAAERHADEIRIQSPMIANESIDVVLSNCVLNLVHPRDRRDLFAELFRVIRPGGRAVISDIVSSKSVPGRLRNDPELWSGCISGAFEEPEFLDAFEFAGFTGMRIVERQSSPWTVVEGIEFRSVTVQAFKPPVASSSGGGEVIYRGPWKMVQHESGIELQRGQKTMVSTDILSTLASEPFADQVIPIQERQTALDAAATTCCDPQKCC